MSSEESDEENTLAVKELPWRTPAVTNLFKILDEEATKRKSDQAKRQSKRRVLGEISARPKPTSVPSWSVTDEY